jgi:hypothetical protein
MTVPELLAPALTATMVIIIAIITLMPFCRFAFARLVHGPETAFPTTSYVGSRTEGRRCVR